MASSFFDYNHWERHCIKFRIHIVQEVLLELKYGEFILVEPALLVAIHQFSTPFPSQEAADLALFVGQVSPGTLPGQLSGDAVASQMRAHPLPRVQEDFPTSVFTIPLALTCASAVAVEAVH